MYECKSDVIKVENLSVVISDKEIIKNINFSEPDVHIDNKQVGQVVCFLGKSGSGKSTLFRAIAGLIPFTGNVKIDKGDNTLVDVKRGDIGYVDQKYTLLIHRTVYQMLKLILLNQTKQTDVINSTINEALEHWDLIECKNKFPKQLSGGQKQRVAILCQLLSSHKYLILDEPASGLDVKNIIKLKKTIKSLSSVEDNNTIIFSTHDIKLAVELSDMIYVMDKGRIIHAVDLKYLGLSWKEFGQNHIELVNKLEEIICL